MTFYAAFDSTAIPPTSVTGWYDDRFGYDTLPNEADLITLTQEQWDAHMISPNGWGINARELVEYIPPPPTLTVQQQAFNLVNHPLVTVACVSNPALVGTYLVDNANRGNITGIAVAINAGLGLPSGEDTFFYPDQTGTPHEWPADKFILFAKGAMVYVYKLSQIAGGVGDQLPDAVITIA